MGDLSEQLFFADASTHPVSLAWCCSINQVFFEAASPSFPACVGWYSIKSIGKEELLLGARKTTLSLSETATSAFRLRGEQNYSTSGSGFYSKRESAKRLHHNTRPRCCFVWVLKMVTRSFGFLFTLKAMQTIMKPTTLYQSRHVKLLKSSVAGIQRQTTVLKQMSLWWYWKPWPLELIFGLVITITKSTNFYSRRHLQCHAIEMP